MEIATRYHPRNPLKFCTIVSMEIKEMFAQKNKIKETKFDIRHLILYSRVIKIL
jgi:hypothetical protein